MANTPVVPPPELRRTILRVFTTKHSLQLHSSAIAFITSTLADHGLLQQPLEWEEAIDALAQGIVDGQTNADSNAGSHSKALASTGKDGPDDQEGSSDLVTAAALETVYSRLVVADSAAHATQAAVRDTANGVHRHAHELTDGELPDPHRYFGVHSAFTQPKLTFDPIRKVFEPTALSATLLPTASTRSTFARQRYHILKGVILRNENFCPPLAIATASSSKNLADGFMKLTSTKNLLGRQGQRFLLFGMLSTSSDGRYELEDADGTVGLDLHDAIPGEGIFTEGSLILVEGEYTVEERIHVFALGHPPSETRAQARSMHAHTDFLGPPQTPILEPAGAPSRVAARASWRGAISVKEEAAFQVHEANHSDLCFVIFSDLHLDHPKTMAAFATVLQGYVDADFIPFALMLCGNFASQQYSSADTVDRYKAGFASLAETLSRFPAIVRSSHIILVPGPQDPFASSLVPRPPLPQGLVEPLVSKLKTMHATIHLASNPCRISYFSQQIVVYRDDMMTRMLRNTVRIKDQAQEQEREQREREERDLKKFLVSTVLDQAHLVPLAQRIRPVLWDHDHALSLYPMPTAVSIARSSGEHAQSILD